jgi:transposase InsO family protein
VDPGALTGAERWVVNVKRVERIGRLEGLKVPKRPPRRGRLWLNDGTCIRLRLAQPNHVWADDVVAPRRHDCRAFRILTILDEFTRECLAIGVARTLTADDVLATLTDLFVALGCPDHLRSDTSPECCAAVVRERLARLEVRPLFIEPGSPWENGSCEAFNGKLRDELLDGEIFTTLREALVLAEGWRQHYNSVRPPTTSWAIAPRPPPPTRSSRLPCPRPWR